MAAAAEVWDKSGIFENFRTSWAGDVRLAIKVNGRNFEQHVFDDDRCLFFYTYFLTFRFAKNDKHVFPLCSWPYILVFCDVTSIFVYLV